MFVGGGMIDGVHIEVLHNLSDSVLILYRAE